MKIDSFSITFEIVTPESVEDGKIADSGCHIEPAQGYSLRDALAWLRLHKGCSRYADCSDSWPCRNPRWFTFDCSEDFRTGENETLALHMPDCVTQSSRMRIARILGHGKYWR